MKRETIYWLGGTAILVGIVSYFVYDLFKNKKQNQNTEIDVSDYDSISSTQPSVSGITTSVFPLKKGSKGNEVTALQKFLNDEQSSNLVVDGDFGPATEKAWLQNQVCDIVANTNTNCWTNYKSMYSKAEVGKVDKQFYDLFVKSYE